MGRNLITNRAFRHLVSHYKQISKSPETLLWYLGVENTGTRSKPISGTSAREKKNFLAKSLSRQGHQNVAMQNNERYKRIETIFCSKIQHEFFTTGKKYIWFGFLGLEIPEVEDDILGPPQLH